MTESGRTPHTSERAEGDPPGDDATDGRTPHSEEPAEGQDVGDDAGTEADDPDA
jgi:hypothetical protein